MKRNSATKPAQEPTAKRRRERASKAGTVLACITRERARTAADWLAHEYMPGEAPIGEAAGAWQVQQRVLADACAAILHKAAARKRQGQNFGLRIKRGLAQWLASFAREGGWWDFNGRLLPGQPGSEAFQHVAAVFLAAVNSRKGRKGRRREAEIEFGLARVATSSGCDARWGRRLKARKAQIEESKRVASEIEQRTKIRP